MLASSLVNFWAHDKMVLTDWLIDWRDGVRVVRPITTQRFNERKEHAPV